MKIINFKFYNSYYILYGRNFYFMEEPINLTGYTCNKCGKIFLDKEEFDNRHKKNKNQDINIDLQNK